jgi:carboxyl-terminal processing protease
VRIRVNAMSYSKIITFILAIFLGGSAYLPALTAPAPLSPSPDDGSIAYITSRLLENFHYSQHPFDTEISQKFYDAYLDSYDSQHLYFLQSDIAEFAHYRTNLDVLTLASHGNADVLPAYKIYARFQERLHERAAYAESLLERGGFKFDTDETVQVDRKDAPYPKNLDDAKHIWRQQVLYDFLHEKLNYEDTPGEAVASTNLAAITQTLKHRYEQELRFYDEWDNGDVLQQYLDCLAHAYDPHSDYMNNEHAQDFSINMSLELFGIGAELQSDDGYCKIASLIPGGPAAKSTLLKQGDKIIAVAQTNGSPVDVIDMELGHIVQLIRGPKGTEVRLTVIPADDPKARRVVRLVRDKINLADEHAKALLIESPAANGTTNRLGVIEVPQFYAPVDSTGNSPQSTNYVTEDVAALITKLMQEKVGGIILNLRNNPGGSLEEAVQFVGLFVPNGPVVQIRSPENHVLPQGNDTAPDLYRGPLIVMVNRLSASASEIVAAALQDYGRALIVGGTSSFGKGTVQNLNPLRPFVWPTSEDDTNDPGMVKISIRKFYRINGASTQLKGVIPDIILPDALSYSDEVGESSLPNAMPWDTIDPAVYTPLDDVQPYLATLRKDSEARVATNQDFTYMRQAITELQKMQSEKTETLNERQAWEENQKMKAQGDARNKEIASRKVPNMTVYEITLADASQPGLPPPIKLVTEYEMTNTVSQTMSTNTVSANEPARTFNLDACQRSRVENQPEKTLWQPDAMLDESERILEDYISLQPSNGSEVANHE